MSTTVVWVMIALSSPGWAIPSLEFKTQQECQTAVVGINRQLKEQGTTASDFNIKHAWLKTTNQNLHT